MKFSDVAPVRPGRDEDVRRLLAVGRRLEASGGDIGDDINVVTLYERDGVRTVPMPWTLVRLGRRRVLIVIEQLG